MSEETKELVQNTAMKEKSEKKLDELTLIRSLHQKLSKLDAAARQRVINYLVSSFGE